MADGVTHSFPSQEGIPPMQPPSIGPTTPRHLSGHLHLPINQVPSPNEDTESSAQSPTHIIQESVLDTPMAILLTPTHPCTMPSLPPQVYLKHIPFTHIVGGILVHCKTHLQVPDSRV